MSRVGWEYKSLWRNLVVWALSRWTRNCRKRAEQQGTTPGRVTLLVRRRYSRRS